jgi:GT2 family glycosyltransferase
VSEAIMREARQPETEELGETSRGGWRDDGSERVAIRSAPLTAVIATYNSARHLAPLADLMSTWSVRPERTLIVDNASSDRSREIGEASGFEVFKSRRNGGFGAACNEGLRIAQSEYVLVCNPDVRPAGDSLALLLNALDETPSAAIAGALLGSEPVSRRFSCLTASIASFLPARLYRRLKLHRGTSAIAGGVEPHLVVDYVEGAFMLCRAAALRSVGGFDERFFLYHEEEDLCRRLGERGWLTLLVPAAKAEHNHSSSSDGVSEGVMTAFRLHSLYWYHRKYRSRLYAELARAAVAACVLCDRLWRACTHRPQIYPGGTAGAPFYDIQTLREKYGLADEQRAT